MTWLVAVALASLLQVTGVEAGGHVGTGEVVPRVVARALPAVVSVTTRHIEWDQFNQPVPTRGLGSGFVVDRRGYVLTNHHVVAGAEEIKVTLADGRTFRASLVGSDRYTDLALLRIDGQNLPMLRLGNSARLLPGQTVIAIGSPLWIEGGATVTVGVVSGLGRSMEQEGLPVLHNLIQTDAAINPGNSGGPLLNVSGEVVGINTAIIPSAHSIGFAVAINDAKPVVHGLLAHGRIVRPGLGLMGVSVTPQVAYANDLAMDRGVLVVRIDVQGPAAAVGIEPGDVIIQTDGRETKDLHTFHEALNRRRPGHAVDVSLLRHGKRLTVRPILREEP